MKHSAKPPLWFSALIGAGKGAAVGLCLWLASHGIGTMRVGPLTISGDSGKHPALTGPSWPITIGIGATLGAIIGVVGEIRSRGRTVLMQEAAARLELNYSRHGQGPVFGGAESVRGLFDGSASASIRIDHVFTGVFDGCTLWIADLTELHNAPSSEASTFAKKKRAMACVVPIEGLPDFTLVPASSTISWYRQLPRAS